MIGTTLGNYRIEEKVGEGGMGVVYRATDTELERAVAVKTLLTPGIPDPDLTARFVREAKAASRLQHPAITTVHQVGVEGNTRYIVMEYVVGKTLKKIIGGSAMLITQLCEIAIQIADGLAAAHEKGVIHRDLKAENIMITPRQQAKILDFGLAKFTSQAGADNASAVSMYQTEAGTLLGTLSYMAPEQALGAKVDSAADIFSFGVVLYEMATGQMPFAGPTPQITLARILNQEPTPVAQLNSQAPPELDRLIQECLRKERTQRPAAAEITRRLKNIQASLSVRNLSAPDIRGSAVQFPAEPISGSAAGGRTMILTPQSRVQVAGSAAAAAAAKAPEPSTVVQAPAPASAGRRGNQAAYYAVRITRWAFSLLALTVPLSYLVYFLIGGGVIRAEILQGTFAFHYMEAIVEPSLAAANKLFAFRPVVNGWNFMLLGLGMATLLLRQLVMLPIERAEQWARAKFAPPKKLRAAGVDTAVVLSAEERGATHRLNKLREYAQAKQYLYQEKQQLAFLSIDVVGSTKMKLGEDKLAIEHAFAEYKKFVERILKQNNIWKVAWTPDGIMCAFVSVPDAVKAGQDVLSGLPWFNNGVHQLKTPFNVRCGINAGEVIFPPDKPMEDISDEAIDVAGHMQKYAAHGALWLSQQVLEQLPDKTGFRLISTQQVDGHTPYEWRADDLGDSAPRGASTPADH